MIYLLVPLIRVLVPRSTTLTAVVDRWSAVEGTALDYINSGPELEDVLVAEVQAFDNMAVI